MLQFTLSLLPHIHPLCALCIQDGCIDDPGLSPGRGNPSLIHATAMAPLGRARVQWLNPDLGDHLGSERVLNPVEECYIIGLGLICLGVKWAILDFF